MLAVDIPHLETKRLILKCPELSDWDMYQSFLLSSRARYMGGPFKKSVAWGWFCADVAQWSLYGHGALMIYQKESSECLGQVCINHGPLFPEKELGWLLYSGAEGNGYAYEAAHAIREWAIECNVVSTLVSYIDPANKKSCKLAENLGAVIDAGAERPDAGDLVYRHPLDELYR